ncbi:alpha-amylase family glycosyl hydrolase [Thalassotalea sp. G2M2-11]|uniref:alpha-amylase family glycosyl hydrolase n=1 Tax=Thalassotalea sp. G2M2-11 TaxID=2787627 RepID=UPI0019CFB820|nr:alpha-amylase family glycosyl hydrolase [Thalassotalea sp. G2M2-11]
MISLARITQLHRTTINGLLLLTTLAITLGCKQQSSSQADVSSTVKSVIASELAPYQQRPIEDEVFYFVLPDRFSNGDSKNDLGAIDIPISYGGFDPSNEMAFHGGDLTGLTNKLPYLEQLGITSIWLTPILRNQAVQGNISGYHGYWVLDFTEIDPHIGSNDDLKQLITQAHQRNIKIFFDIITNHTADVIKYKECHGEDGSGWSESGEPCPYISLAEKAQGKHYQTVIQAGNEALKSPSWLNDPVHYHNQGDSTFEGENSLNGDFFGLDDINTESPTVVNGMIDIYKHIISEFKPDGFRIDTVKHVNIEFWQQFAPALQQHAEQQGINNFFMFGEVYSFDPIELSKFTTEGKLPSVLDFGLQSALYQTLIEAKPSQVFEQLFAQDALYQNANQLLNFTGNHDMGRFAYLLSKQKQFSSQEIAQRFKLASAITFYVRGVPVIYYGDEQGFIGNANNHNARQDMMPSKVVNHNQQALLLSNGSTADDNFNQQHPLYQYFAKLASTYHQHPTLKHGKQTLVYSSEQSGLLVINKKDEHGDYLIAFNTSTSTQSATLELDGHYQLITQSAQSPSEHSQLTANGQLQLAGLSFAIYRH